MWFGQLGHAASVWMEQVIRPLLMLHLTGSALQVGGIVSARMVPQLVFGLIAGAVADRYNKKLILMSTQFLNAMMQLAMGLLIITGHIQAWHVYVGAIGSGTINAFSQPARQSILPRLVPRSDLLNALALQTAAMTLMRFAGASLAGVLLIFMDFEHVYFVDAGLYLVIIYTTIRMNVPKEMLKDDAAGAPDATAPQEEGRRNKNSSIFGDLAEGFKYIKSKRNLVALIGIALILFVFGQPYTTVFVPLIALDVLHADRSVVGFLLAVTGIGALAGSLVVATIGRVKNRSIIMVSSMILFGLVLIALALSTWLWLSIVILFLTGAISVTYMSLNTSLLLEQTPSELHGRVLSFMSLDRGLMSAGALLGGFLAEVLGTSSGLIVMGGACSVLATLTLLLAPTVRKIS